MAAQAPKGTFVRMDEKSEVSSTEGIKEWKVDINQIESLSAEVPSGVIHEGDVDIDVGKKAGSSDTGAGVLHQAVGSCSTNSRNEESFTDPSDTIKAAHEAAENARGGAVACLKTLDASSSAIKIGRKSIDSAIRKANAAAGHQNANRYRSLAQKCRKATKRVLDAACEAESAVDTAEVAADNADDSATKLAEVLNLRPEDIRNRQQWATSVTNTANISAVDAYKKKYLLLKAMKKCWEEVDSKVICRTESSVTVTCDNQYRNICTNTAAVILFVLGCVLLSLPNLVKLSSQSKDAVVGMGVIMVALTSAMGMYRLLRYLHKHEKANERKSRLKKIASIQEDLHILENYFENNNISPVQSSSEEEQ